MFDSLPRLNKGLGKEEIALPLSLSEDVVFLEDAEEGRSDGGR